MRPAASLDWIDIKILTHLQKAARCSNVDLADAVGLSPSPCLVRVKRLGDLGFIRGYNANIALDMIGDFALAARPIQARIIAHKTGHAMNHALTKRLLEMFGQD